MIYKQKKLPWGHNSQTDTVPNLQSAKPTHMEAHNHKHYIGGP